MKIKPYPFPFSVADTMEGPVIQWSRHSLFLEFTDWREDPRRVEFREVPHFEFVLEDELTPGAYQYDGTVEVVDSPLIARLVELGEINAADRKHFHHIIIGFNEIGSCLIVVFRELFV